VAFWRLLSGIAFEKELGALFKMMGDIVKETPRSGDGGVDLLLSMNGQLTVVQCKAHNKRIPIGTARELSASLLDFKANDAIIACFEGVTKPVVKYIMDKPIKVLTVDDIVEIQRKRGSYPKRFLLP
jgi:restriction system protein